MALRHAAALVLFAAFIHVAGAPAHAQNAPITNPPNVITPPAALPDLVVTKVTVTLKCVGGNTITATINTTVTNKAPYAAADLTKASTAVQAAWWAVKGEGALVGPSNQTIAPHQAANKVLPPNVSWSTSLVIQSIPEYKKTADKPWQYTFVVQADPLNQLAESNEKNNEAGVYGLDPCPK